jgi:hypothetical protein
LIICLRKDSRLGVLKNLFNFIPPSATTKINIMKNTMIALFVSVAIFALTGCAPVQFYSNSGLTVKTGLKYYTTKPFLHVERDPQTNKIVKAAVIYLPDLANPQYMVIREGLNSKKINLKFTNGTLDTFGYTSTGKVGESVDALAGMVTKGTDALTELNTLKSLQAVKASPNTVELYEIVFGADKTTLKEVTIGKE